MIKTQFQKAKPNVDLEISDNLERFNDMVRYLWHDNQETYRTPPHPTTLQAAHYLAKAHRCLGIALPSSTRKEARLQDEQPTTSAEGRAKRARHGGSKVDSAKKGGLARAVVTGGYITERLAQVHEHYDDLSSQLRHTRAKLQRTELEVAITRAEIAAIDRACECLQAYVKH